jgi:hypothetical protein
MAKIVVPGYWASTVACLQFLEEGALELFLLVRARRSIVCAGVHDKFLNK